MSTVDLKVELPDALSPDEARLLLAVKLYELSKISLGEGAQVAGCSKRAFMAALGQQRLPVFAYPAAELREEVER